MTDAEVLAQSGNAWRHKTQSISSWNHIMNSNLPIWTDKKKFLPIH